jgi:hypothetical protein
VCTDGDAACDADGRVNKSCQFSVSVCVFQTDVAGFRRPSDSEGWFCPDLPCLGAGMWGREDHQGASRQAQAVSARRAPDGKPKVDRDSLLKCLPGVASPTRGE